MLLFYLKTSVQFASIFEANWTQESTTAVFFCTSLNYSLFFHVYLFKSGQTDKSLGLKGQMEKVKD